MWLACRRNAAVVSAAAAATAACPPHRRSSSAAPNDGSGRPGTSTPAPSRAQPCAPAVRVACSAAHPLRPTQLLRAARRRHDAPHSADAAPPPPQTPAPTAVEPSAEPSITRPATSTQAGSRTTDLLRSIARRGGGAVRPRPRSHQDARTAPSTAALAALLRPAAPPAANTHKAAADAPAPSPPPPSPPPSRALLQKLLHTIRTEKRVNWDALTAHHSEVLRMPLYECRTEWVTQQCSHCSATSMSTDPSVQVRKTDGRSMAPESLPPLLLCTAATGTGKSALIPLFALDAHWAALEHRLVHTIRLLDDAATAAAAAALPAADGAASAFPVDSRAAFIAEFTRCSSVCILVSQPTRVACAELAAYTSALLDAGRSPPATPAEAPAASAPAHRSELVGKRIGFAVGGEARFCAATEIVFATPGYVLNALQLAPRAPPSRPRLTPTTLMVDEAHCRDMETDALLAWVKLSRGTLVQEMPRLRQYYVMSATMHLHAMYAYLAKPAHVAGSVEAAAPSDASVRPPLVLLLSPAQRAHVRRWWRTRGISMPASGGAPSDAEVDAALMAAVHADASVRAGVLRRTAVADLCGDTEDSAGAVGSAPVDVARSTGGAAVVIATRPHRVERFFVDDLDPAHGRFAESRVLFGDRGAASGSRGGHGAASPSSNNSSSSAAAHSARTTSSAAGSGTPLCLSHDGETARQHLCILLGTRASAYAMQSTVAQALVTFLLQLLQAARCRWVVDAAAAEAPPASPASAPPADAPVTLLLFVAGLGELQFITQALERVCDMTLPAPARTNSHRASPSPASSALGTAAAPVLRHGAEVFSLGLLHSSAVGSPQEQLVATERAGAPLRLLIATNVAESSLTIPNTRIVVDTCLERRVQADDVTGATHVRTAFVSPSGLRQRCGRVGRTGDGIVIHLAPRSFVLPEYADAEAGLHAGEGGGPAASSHATRASDELEALPDGAIAVVLRMKYLFPAVSTALAALPSPPRASQARLALEQLADAELLLLPEGVEGDGAGTEGSGAPHLHHLLDSSVLTAKGRLVASLPLPHENANLVYHGLQFRCVEDAVLIACATAVPSLFASARVSPYSAVHVGERRWTASHYAARRPELDLKPALSPLEQFYRTLWVQRDLAGFAVPQESPDAAAASPPSDRRRAEYLSEPLMLRALLRQWYAFSNGEACVRFIASHGVNRSALRQVDGLVALCCGRLIRLLQKQQSRSADGHGDAAPPLHLHVPEDAESEVDFGVYVSDDSAAPPIAFLCDWPDGVRDQVLRSLRRLHRVAQHRAGLRHSGPQGRLGLPQWHGDDERLVRLCSQPYVAPHAAEAGSRWVSADTDADDGRGAGGGSRSARDAVRRHPSFAYWGVRMAAQQPLYPSLYAAHHLTSRVAVTPSHTVPPPLVARVTQARLPAYRPPPPPPPPIPSVVYVMGRTEDRLCGAFVAAYGHRTLRGEDGGHRFHHRRLRRNLQALEHDEAHVCTFHVDLQGPQQQQQPVGEPPAVVESAEGVGEGERGWCAPPAAVAAPTSSSSPQRSGATAELISAALEPYLAGAGLLQLHVFQHKRLAVAARFATSGFRGLFGTHTLQNIVPSASAAATPAVPSNISSSGSSIARGDADAGEEGEFAAVVGDSSRGDVVNAALLRPAVLPAGLRPEDVKGGGLRTPPPHDNHGRLAGDAALTASSSSSHHHPFVQLAPFGVSLLVAATAGSGGGISGLQRIPVPHTAVPPHRSLASTDGDTAVPAAAEKSPQPGAAPTSMVMSSAGRHGLGTRDRAVSYADAVALGLAHLLPTAAAGSVSSAAAVSARRGGGNATATPFLMSGEDAGEDDIVAAAEAPHEHTPEHASTSPLTLSVVPPVYVTHSITWRVPLPVAAPRLAPAAPELPYCPLCNQLCPSAALLQQHFSSAVHLDHLYHAVQLGLRHEHLAVLYGLQSPRPTAAPPAHVAAATASGGSRSTSPAIGHADAHRETPRVSPLPLLSLLGAADANDAHRRPVAQRLHPCSINALSYLNCLQVNTTAAASAAASPLADRATPLAVAGSLVASHGAGDVIPPPHLRASRTEASAVSESLVAHHVWVLNFATVGETPPRRAPSATTASASTGSASPSSSRHPPPPQQQQPPPTAALCIVAGYLAAASTQAMVALLFNRAHTHLHAVMVYGLGVWRLPTPLPMQRYMGVLEHISNGGGWPGLLVPLPRSGTSTGTTHTQDGEGEACGVAEGLHWCAPASACAMSMEESPHDTASAPSSAGAGTTAVAARAVADRDAVVSAALLLVLHEYAQARRSVVMLVDYVERVLHKLQLASFVSPAGAHDNALTATPAGVLVDFLQRARRGQQVQSLLRDIGCLFATPPSALAALTDTAETDSDAAAPPETPPSSPRLSLARRLGYRALSSEAASLEMMFTVPPVLPSVLPPPDFAARLRQFYAAQHTRRWRPRPPPAAQSPVTASSRGREDRAAARRARGLQLSRPTRRHRRGRGSENDELF